MLKIIIALFITVVLYTYNAFAFDKRFALIINNSAYQSKAFLEHLATNTTKLKSTLEKLGFEVIAQEDIERVDIASLKKELHVTSHIALFYFAGHAIQFAGEIYLIPIGMESVFLSDDLKTLNQTLKLSDVLKAMQVADYKIIILDANYNNPFQPQKKHEMIPIKEIPDKTLIAYSTNPGELVYTENLLTSLQGIAPPQFLSQIEEVLKNIGKWQKSDKMETSQNDKMETLQKSEFYFLIIGIIFGIIFGVIITRIFLKKHEKKKKTSNSQEFGRQRRNLQETFNHRDC